MWSHSGTNSSKGELFRSNSKGLESGDALKRWLTETPPNQNKFLGSELSTQLKLSNSRNSLAKTATETLHPSHLSLNRARQSIRNWSIERKSSLTNIPAVPHIQETSGGDQGFSTLIKACKAKKESLDHNGTASFKKNLSHHLIGNKLITLTSTPHKICYRSIQASRFKSLGKEVVDKSRHDRIALGHLTASATSVLKEIHSSRFQLSTGQGSELGKLRRGNSMFLNQPGDNIIEMNLQYKSSSKILGLTNRPIEIVASKKPLGWHLFDKSRCTTNTRVKDRITSYKSYLQAKPALL